MQHMLPPPKVLFCFQRVLRKAPKWYVRYRPTQHCSFREKKMCDTISARIFWVQTTLRETDLLDFQLLYGYFMFSVIFQQQKQNGTRNRKTITTVYF